MESNQLEAAKIVVEKNFLNKQKQLLEINVKEKQINENNKIQEQFLVMETEKPQKSIFEDDVLLKDQQNEDSEDAKVEISLMPLRSQVKLKTQSAMPAICSIKTSGGSRNSVDLICLIDISGSMDGNKIKLVKKTLEYLLNLLRPSDRLCIITFNTKADKVCGFLNLTNENKAVIFQKINKITADGGTSIKQGLKLSIQSLQRRKERNYVSSIFLLSDGRDDSREVLSYEQLIQKKQNCGIFSIHTFGFGNDHDQLLMTRISTAGKGNFYYIKELATLDEAFCSAFGGIISIAALQLNLTLKCVASGFIKGINIQKVYGQMWNKVSDSEYNVKIIQLISGVTKDYVFKISVPAIEGRVEDLQRNVKIMKGQFFGKALSGKQIYGQAFLTVTLLNENQSIIQMHQNVEVVENYFRIRASDRIKDCMKMAKNGKYQQARKQIRIVIKKIQESTKIRKQKLRPLVNDLKELEGKFSAESYRQQGNKLGSYLTMTHSLQANSGHSYSNQIQKTLIGQNRQTKISQMELKEKEIKKIKEEIEIEEKQDDRIESKLNKKNERLQFQIQGRLMKK